MRASKHASKQADRQTDRQTDRQKDRKTERQKDRQTNNNNNNNKNKKKKKQALGVVFHFNISKKDSLSPYTTKFCNTGPKSLANAGQITFCTSVQYFVQYIVPLGEYDTW